MNLYGIHCTRVCVGRKSLYTLIMKSGFVSIFGKPSVGKSSLMNTILGTKLSIVSPKQQTTWYNILGILNKKDAQVCFVDTPGYHKVSKSKLNKYLVDTALQSLEDIEVVYFVIDQSAYPDAEYEEMIAIVIKLGKPIFLVVNKLDLDTAKRHEMVAAPFAEKLHPTAVFHVSAATGAGVSPLVKATIDAMPVGEPYFDDKTLTSHPIELIVADTVREQLFSRLQDELPYSTAVVTDDITESAKGIRAMVSVYVAKDSQKGMIIGKGGELIATIKDVARKNLVHFLGERVELDLRVKVEKNWNRKLLTMKHFGLVVSKK
jgi:GTP-binding protein Era